MSKYLSALGHKVTVLTADYGIDDAFLHFAPEVQVVRFKSYGGRFCYTPSMGNWLEKEIRRFDAIHLMNHWTYQNIAGYHYAIKYGIPFIFSAMGALPIVYRSLLLKKIYHQLYGRDILRDAAILMAITKNECRQYEEFDIPQEKIFYLPNAIDTEEYFVPVPKGEFLRKQNIPPGFKTILYLGRLAPIKGPDLLLEGFIRFQGEMKDTLLVFVGPDYDMKLKMQERAKVSGVADKVRFVDPLTGKDKLEAYSDCDLFVVPSRQENMSIVALEAMALSKPVVITDACDFAEIEESGAGRVVPPEPSALIKAAMEILSDPLKHRQCSENAKKLVTEHFTWKNLSKQYETLLEKISGKPSR